jgi:hypothetical protein
MFKANALPGENSSQSTFCAIRGAQAKPFKPNRNVHESSVNNPISIQTTKKSPLPSTWQRAPFGCGSLYFFGFRTGTVSRKVRVGFRSSVPVLTNCPEPASRSTFLVLLAIGLFGGGSDRENRFPVKSGYQAYWMSCHVTALLSYGGIVFPFEIGAVVDGFPTTFQTPLSGHFSPVRAVVPMGLRPIVVFDITQLLSAYVGLQSSGKCRFRENFHPSQETASPI